MKVEISPSATEELGEVLALLKESGLPLDGLEDHREALLLLVAREGGSVAGRVAGSAALELYGEAALLRSVAVREGMRGRGLGERPFREALARARERGVERVYLLTETAEGFFPRFGFRPAARGEAPQVVRDSVEFASACPASARMMVTDVQTPCNPTTRWRNQ